MYLQFMMVKIDEMANTHVNLGISRFLSAFLPTETAQPMIMQSVGC